MMLLPAMLLLQPAPAKTHPTITEVLYAVPGRAEGDANKDGKRSSGGDEFVELVNLSDKPIDLKGYKLLDSNAWDAEQAAKDAKASPDGKPDAKAPTDAKPSPAGKPREGAPRERVRFDAPGEHVRFVFPALVLKPGEVVVVFNGFESSVPGAVGDSAKAAGPNDQFAGAYVFTMKITSQYAAFGNDGDWVMLVDPDGSPVQTVRWGAPKVEAPAARGKTYDAPDGNASVQLDTARSAFVPHRERKGAAPYSPGVFAAPNATPTAKPEAPAPKAPDAPTGKP